MSPTWTDGMGEGYARPASLLGKCRPVACECESVSDRCRPVVRECGSRATGRVRPSFSASVLDDDLGEVVRVLGHVRAGAGCPGLDDAGRALEVAVDRPEREPGRVVRLREAQQRVEVGLEEQL